MTHIGYRYYDFHNWHRSTKYRM